MSHLLSTHSLCSEGHYRLDDIKRLVYLRSILCQVLGYVLYTDHFWTIQQPSGIPISNSIFQMNKLRLMKVKVKSEVRFELWPRLSAHSCSITAHSLPQPIKSCISSKLLMNLISHKGKKCFSQSIKPYLARQLVIIIKILAANISNVCSVPGTVLSILRSWSTNDYFNFIDKKTKA